MDMGDSDAAAFYLRSALRISGATQRTGVPNRGMGSSITSEDVQLANTFTQLGRQRLSVLIYIYILTDSGLRCHLVR